ncbi:MAG TPA: hypothetical protein VGH19_22995 [Verrucomicrobiae bacterium]
MATRIQIAKSDIVKLLDQQKRHVFTRKDLAGFLAAGREGWRLTQATNVQAFIDFLSEKSHLRKVILKAEDYADETRYVWRSATPYQIALSLGKNAYLTHGTAVFLHALTEQVPKMIFVNIEQSPKPQPQGNLTDESLKRAFAAPQRFTRLIYGYEDIRIAVLSGKNTQRLEVGTLVGPAGEEVDGTKLERTLIDIAVRPAYAGGVHKVLETYQAAKNKVSINTLLATLKKLNYVYPYHQAIGFYLEKSGYETSRLALVEKIPRLHNFYLANALEDPAFDSKWKLFYPRSGF